MGGSDGAMSYVMRQPTLAEMFGQELGLEVEFELTTGQVLFWHRHHGAICSTDRYTAMHPGEWMAELREALDLLKTFEP